MVSLFPPFLGTYRCSLGYNIERVSLHKEVPDDKAAYSLPFSSRLPNVLLTCGDYDFQTAIMELIFRFISIKADRQSLCSWFKGYPKIQSALVNTPFKDFDPVR